MTQTLILFAGIIISFLIGLFTSRKTSSKDAKVIDLTGKINANKALADKAQKDADAKVKEYQDALKAYDPTFHDDDGDGKPSA